MFEATVVVPIGISLLAFLVSALNLYISQVRPASLSVVAGEHVNVYHFKEGNCGITLPVNISNTGARGATVRRLALLVQEAGSREGYIMEPLFYQKLDEDGNFQTESQPVPITVAGRGAETKQVLFRSSLENPREFGLVKSGQYKFTVLAWIKNSNEPQSADSFFVVLSDSDASALAARRDSQNTVTVRLQQSRWRKWAAHRLTDLEVSALQGQNVG